jgi:hypothetical protein
MESPAFIDDEVIADSEEDMEQDIYPGPGGQYHPSTRHFPSFWNDEHRSRKFKSIQSVLCL